MIRNPGGHCNRLSEFGKGEKGIEDMASGQVSGAKRGGLSYVLCRTIIWRPFTKGMWQTYSHPIEHPWLGEALSSWILTLYVLCW